jgi:2-aminoadipate transaminase
MTTPWVQRYSSRARKATSSAIRELLKLTQQPDILSFAGGLPAPELFPIDRFREAADTVLAEQGRIALQYSTTEGYPPLREMIARHLERYRIPARPANVLITASSQQALDLIGKLLINPGDRLMVESPTYLGALQAFNMFEPEYTCVPVDDDGLQSDHLEEALRAGPKFMYLLPNFQNPAGVTLSLERRRDIIAMADHYGIPIVEDDPYGQLRYEGEHLPPLFVLDRENARDDDGYERGNVIYLSTFSKTLAPGLRLGWIVAPVEVIAKLVQIKQAADLHTSTFTQMVAYEVARGGFLDSHVRHLRDVYRVRRDAMLAALQEHFPPGVAWTRPHGGLFLWVTLPEGMDSHTLLEEAVRQKVAFVPGDPFFAFPEEGTRHCRLNFSCCSVEQIQEGMGRLGAAIRKQMVPVT